MSVQTKEDSIKYKVGDVIKITTPNKSIHKGYQLIIKVVGTELYTFYMLDDIACFKKINSQGHNIEKTGYIRNHQMKLELLKYYRTHKLQEKEKKFMADVINIAYPNGVPEYNPAKKLDIKTNITKLTPGRKIKLYTTTKTPFRFLNEKKYYIIANNQNGMWIANIENNEAK